jgi:hypothetical protein
MTRRTIAMAMLLGFSAAAARAQQPVASVVSAAAGVDVQRGGKGEWQPLTSGGAVYPGDVVRTAPSGFTRLIFADDTVVNLGVATVLRVAHYAGTKRPRRSSLRLDQGALDALVTGYDGSEDRFEVETPTAFVRTQQANVIVRVDPDAAATDVAALDGSVSVQGTTGIIGPGVVVSANEATRVPRDGFPSPAKALETGEARNYARGLDVIGTGTGDGLDRDNPIVDGRLVAAEDRPPTGGAAAAARGSDERYLHPGAPGETLLETLSPDLRANTQPLPVYRAVPPNQSPVPPH